jgi:hypothetical protein
MGEHERHYQGSRGKDQNVPGPAQLKLSDATDEEVGHGKVEETPKRVDRRGR